MSTTTETAAKVFLTDYASYNDGSQFEFGHWVNLDQFSDVDEFTEYCRNHFEECDQKRPIEGSTREEWMITDYEGFPEQFYSESFDSSLFEQLFKYLELDWDNKSDSEKVSLWNEYCSENGYSDDEIFIFDEEFFTTFFEGKPMEAARAATFGSLNWSDEYIKFNGYGNLESFNDPSGEIDEKALIEWLIENK